MNFTEFDKKFVQYFDSRGYWKSNPKNNLIPTPDEIKQFVETHYLSKAKLIKEIEGMKGGGRGISESPGLMYDWGYQRGYDMALDKVIERIKG